MKTASFMLVTMVFQTLYVLIDLLAQFELRDLVGVKSGDALQMLLNLLLLRREFGKHLGVAPVYAAERQPLPTSDS